MQSKALKKEKLIWLGVMAVCAVFTLLETVSAVLHDRSVQDYVLCGIPTGVLCFSAYKGLMKFAVVRQYQGIVLLILVLASLPIVFIYSYVGEPVSYANRTYFPLIIFIAGFVMCGLSTLYVSTGKSILNPESN